MALSTSLPNSIRKTHYNNTLLFCLFTSLALCFTTLKVIPSDPENIGSSRDKIILACLRIFLSIFIFLTVLYALILVRRRDRHHQNQEVFWPSLCYHCKTVVTIRPQMSRISDIAVSKQQNEHPLMRPTETSGHCARKSQVNLLKPCKRRISHNRSIQATSIRSRSDSYVDRQSGQSVPVSCGYQQEQFGLSKARLASSLPAKTFELFGDENKEVKLDETDCRLQIGSIQLPRQVEDGDRMAVDIEDMSVCCDQNFVDRDRKYEEDRKNENTKHTPFHCNPHMSLLNTFYVFGTITIINIPLQLIGIVMWLFQNCYSSLNCFGVATQALKDISFIVIVAFGMVFFTTYYNAVFVEGPQFSYPFGILVIGSIYMVIGKFVSPIGEILGNPINEIGYLYRLNGTFGEFLIWHEKILTPFYAELGIIASGVMWHIWTSSYPRSCLNIPPTLPPCGKINITNPISSCRKLMRSISSRLFRKKSPETETLLSKKSKARNFQPLIRPILMIYLVLCACYFGLNQFLRHSESVKLLNSEKEYIKWSTEIACSLPVLSLYHYQMFVSNSKRSFYPKARVSLFNGLLESHDRVLLLSCIGIFTVTFFRLFGAIGILTHKAVTGDEIALACFAIVYSSFKIYSVWVMTSFLATVQRQLLRCSQEIKWTLIPLACSVVWNISLWLQESLELASWEELKMFYGDTMGKLIGTLLEPVSTLYGLHAAMVAFEAYKDICSDDEMLTTQNIQRWRDRMISNI